MERTGEHTTQHTAYTTKVYIFTHGQFSSVCTGSEFKETIIGHIVL